MFVLFSIIGILVGLEARAEISLQRSKTDEWEAKRAERYTEDPVAAAAEDALYKENTADLYEDVDTLQTHQPDEAEIQRLILEQKKQELLNKYIGSSHL